MIARRSSPSALAPGDIRLSADLAKVLPAYQPLSPPEILAVRCAGRGPQEFEKFQVHARRSWCRCRSCQPCWTYARPTREFSGGNELHLDLLFCGRLNSLNFLKCRWGPPGLRLFGRSRPTRSGSSHAVRRRFCREIRGRLATLQPLSPKSLFLLARGDLLARGLLRVPRIPDQNGPRASASERPDA